MVKNKRGEMKEIVKILIAVIVLLTVIAIITNLYFKGGGDIMSSIKNVFRFGR